MTTPNYFFTGNLLLNFKYMAEIKLVIQD